MYKSEVPPGSTYVACMALSFVCAITVVAWSSYTQVQSKLLERDSIAAVEAFRKKTTFMFLLSSALFGVSAVSFIIAFSFVGFIKPWLQTKDAFEYAPILPYLLGSRPPGTVGLVNRLASAYWVEIKLQSSYLNYALPIAIAGWTLLAIGICIVVYVYKCFRDLKKKTRLNSESTGMVDSQAVSRSGEPEGGDPLANQRVETALDFLGSLASQGSFVAGNVFFEIVFTSISFYAAPTLAYISLASIAFLLATVVMFTSVSVPVAMSNAGAKKESARKEFVGLLLQKLKPLLSLTEGCFIAGAWHVLVLTSQVHRTTHTVHCSVIRLDDVSSCLGPKQVPAIFMDNLHPALLRPPPHDAAAHVHQVPHLPLPPCSHSAHALVCRRSSLRCSQIDDDVSLPPSGGTSLMPIGSERN